MNRQLVELGLNAKMSREATYGSQTHPSGAQGDAGADLKPCKDRPESEEIVTPLVEPTDLELIRKIAAAPPIPQLIKFFGLCGYHVARVGPVAITRWGKRGGRCFDGPVHSRGPIFGSDAPSAQKAGCRRNHRSEEWLHTHPLPLEDERWALS